MKKEYINPDIVIKVFSYECVVTTSGGAPSSSFKSRMAAETGISESNIEEVTAVEFTF